ALPICSGAGRAGGVRVGPRGTVRAARAVAGARPLGAAVPVGALRAARAPGAVTGTGGLAAATRLAGAVAAGAAIAGGAVAGAAVGPLPAVARRAALAAGCVPGQRQLAHLGAGDAAVGIGDAHVPGVGPGAEHRGVRLDGLARSDVVHLCELLGGEHVGAERVGGELLVGGIDAELRVGDLEVLVLGGQGRVVAR